MPDSDGQLEIIVSAIERYLEEHENAADSAEGVAKWWLGPDARQWSVELVEQALEHLVSRGELQRTTTRADIAIYSRPRPRPEQ